MGLIGLMEDEELSWECHAVLLQKLYNLFQFFSAFRHGL